ncbi:metallophosphoesterase [Pontibacter liquoris]|uniref:metallophosphoesterase n=1 Tax=Pontibacter liquoris TaxID=2905677 RepID=UPI001FA7CF55|nr:metallophosphoesterase [Pontibacter liquoris]
MKRFVTSDSHGGYRALVQCLARCGFDKKNDQLFFLGDVVDGWSETKESIELLLSLRHLLFLLGNHDQWALAYYSHQNGRKAASDSWQSQGGRATVKSYGAAMPPAHLALLQKARLYHITSDNILFVHAGFDECIPIEENDAYTLLWSRDFVEEHYSHYKQHKPDRISPYKEVYIGHTPTIALDRKQTSPLHMENLTLIDTGAAFTGCLSIMDLDSKQVWQSDKVMTLYPNETGRNRQTWNQLLKSGGSVFY